MKITNRGPVSLILFFFFSSFALHSEISFAGDTLTSSETLPDGKTLISSGESFAFGFFTPGQSKNRYLGIWYNKVSVRTVVWVANREFPLTDTSGVFKIDNQGRRLILNGSEGVIWSSVRTHATNPAVQLLDTGNLIVREEEDSSQDFFWQSFDYPSDTLLPGMKLGLNLKTGLDRFLSSWKNADDPSPGDYTVKIDRHGLPQAFLRRGSTILYREPWTEIQFIGFPELGRQSIFNSDFVFNMVEIYYIYELVNNSIFSRLLVNYTGDVERYTWTNESGGGFWNRFWWARNDQCDDYVECGDFGICSTDGSAVCKCVKGFQPRTPQSRSGGCVRRMQLVCEKGDGFYKLTRMKLPDTSSAFVDYSMGAEECEDKCLKNCSCTAYSRAGIRGGSACVIWSSNLIDLKQYSDGGQDLYVRLSGSELGKDKRLWRWAIIPSVVVMVIVLAVSLLFNCWRRKLTLKGNKNTSEELFLELGADMASINELREESEVNNGGKKGLPMQLLSLSSIVAATDNFSRANKLGGGGFGPVYKGRFPNGQTIAIKRLSRSSGQGLMEFKNEIILIAKLQHMNLVRLLGCCIEGEERMLLYEYMPNKSLDFFLFDPTKRKVLDWAKRIHIIEGIAQGLLYLHKYSRLRIIHRDLKASNILLDGEMHPKISDFGLARIFGRNELQANTNRVVGTYGYMSPEYAMEGLFSEKSDVFSFGVLLLEIISSKKNTSLFESDRSLNLLGYAWELWKDGRGLDLLDPTLGDLAPSCKVMRCIHVGLLCVEERPMDRPTMADVVLMLNNESMPLPSPIQPAFFRYMTHVDLPPDRAASCSINEVSLSATEGR